MQTAIENWLHSVRFSAIFMMRIRNYQSKMCHWVWHMDWCFDLPQGEIVGDEGVLIPKHETSMIIHNLFEIRAEHLFIPSDCRTRGIVAFRTIYTRADVYRFFFFPHTIITWNSIPPRSTSGQYKWPVTDRARVYYPSRAVPGVNSDSILF